MLLVRNTALLDILISTVNEVFPSLGDDARVVIVCRVIDEKAKVVVACLVCVIVVKLDMSQFSVSVLSYAIVRSDVPRISS